MLFFFDDTPTTAIYTLSLHDALPISGLGFRLGYAPGAVVGHPARRTWPELGAKWLRVNLETFKLYLHNGRGRLGWVVRCLALPPSALVHTPKVLASRQLPSFRARMLAVAMLWQTRFWRMFHGLSLTFS